MKHGRLWLFALTIMVLAAAPPVSADQWYEHYARAEQALVNSEYSTAVAELNQAIARRGD